MEHREFQERLRTTGTYETPVPCSRGPVDALIGRADAWFYFIVTRVVFRARAVARRGPYDDDAWARSSFDMVRCVERCGGRVCIDGVERARNAGGPCVYVSNHMSMLETVVLPVVLLSVGRLAIVVKSALLDYPVFGTVLRAVEPISVGRLNPREDLAVVFEEGERALRGGRSVLIFPQATRSPVFDPAAFNSLGVKLARKAQVPVAPLALRTDFLGIGRLVKEFGPLTRSQPVRIRIGEPARVTGTGREEHQRIVAFLSETLAAWGAPVKGPS